MEITLKFILCKEYDFDGNHGISCKAYDPKANKIVSVKTDKLLNAFVFGDDLLCEIVPNGNYLNYVAIA